MLAHGQTGFVYDAQFNVVISGSDENKRFFALTPSGSVTLTTVSEDLFEPGKDYYIDFVPVEPSMEKRQDNLDAEAEELDPNE